jgi:hypothetical protein
MRFRFLCTLALAMSACTFDAQAAQPQHFSIAGMRLYQTSTQILSTLKARGMKINGIGRVACLRDDLIGIAKAADPTRPTVDTHCIGEILASSSSGQTATVDFIEDYPAHPGVSVAYKIAYAVRGAAETLHAQLRDRYGPPTWAASQNYVEAWCQPVGTYDPSGNPCEKPWGDQLLPVGIEGAEGSTFQPDPAMPSVVLMVNEDSIPFGLRLYDVRFFAARNNLLIERINAAVKAHTKPSF